MDIGNSQKTNIKTTKSVIRVNTIFTLALSRVPKSAQLKIEKIPNLYVTGRLLLENKCYHMKVLLNSFHLNGHTLGFDPQTRNWSKNHIKWLGSEILHWKRKDR